MSRARAYLAGELRDVCGLDGRSTFLWPRWILLRALAVLFIVIFAGIMAEGQALIGPKGIAPLGTYFPVVAKYSANPVEMLIRAPTLFWFGDGSAMIGALEWCGMGAAVALLLGVWPRVTLFACWLFLLSFVASWQAFSSTIIDEVMLETSLLAVAFAPSGFFPGLGAKSPPRAIAVFTMRWLLFRMMFESGIMKIVLGDPHWRNFTATELMYETSPFPTIIGYWVHQLPHGFHVGEVAFTYVAEILAPLAAIFCGRRGRWVAFLCWVAFQMGIQLTSNFGWLNSASMALGVVLLDDQMLVSAARAFRLSALARYLDSKVTRPVLGAIGAWRLYGLRALLGTHFLLTLYVFAVVLLGRSLKDLPQLTSRPVEYLFGGLRSANVYYPYAYFFSTKKFEVEFEGSNDGGRTWRTYPFKFKAQQTDRICPFIAPWYARFEATIEIATFNVPRSRLMPKIAVQLINRNPDVLNLFDGDPFPDAPARMVRMPVYEFSFTDKETHDRTGLFWEKKLAGYYLPMVYVNDENRIVEATE